MATKRDRIGEQRIKRRERRRRRATADFLVTCRNPTVKIGRATSELLGARDRALLVDEIAAARLPLTIDSLSERTGSVWREIGRRAFDMALAELGSIERELARLIEAAR